LKEKQKKQCKELEELTGELGKECGRRGGARRPPAVGGVDGREGVRTPESSGTMAARRGREHGRPTHLGHRRAGSRPAAPQGQK